MILFTRDKNKVYVQIELNLGGHSTYFFLRDVGNNESDEALAELLVRHIRNNLSESMCEIRKEAYDQGCKDRRAGKRKAKVFSGSMRSGINHGGCW